MSISFSPDAAAVQQPKTHKTAKHAANIAATSAALYGLYKGTGYLIQPFQDAALSGKGIKYPTGFISSKLCKFFEKCRFFDKLGKIFVPDEKLDGKIVTAAPAEPLNPLKRFYQIKGARGAIAVAATAGTAAIATLAAGIYNAVKISKQPAASTSRFPKNSPEVDKFMQGTMDDIAINQMEVKLNILKDKMTAYDTTPEQRAAMKQEYDATNKEYEEAKKAHGIA